MWILVMNRKRDINVFNLKVSKQTRSKTSKNKLVIKILSNISINYVN